VHTHSLGYPCITTEDHSPVEIYAAKDVQHMNQELSDTLFKDLGHKLNKVDSITVNKNFQERTGNSTVQRMVGDYSGASYKVETWNELSESMSSGVVVNKNQSLNYYNFQLHNQESAVERTQVSAGSVDFTVDSAGDNPQRLQTPHMSDGCDLSVNIDMITHNLEKLDEDQDCS
ncbi:unnamed protein product, partial [Candidula unifasciata]